MCPALVAAAVLMACLAALSAASREAEAAFAGENGRIAFSARGFTGETNLQIFTVEPDGTDTRQLTDTTVRHYNTEPSYSPDGKKVAWNRSGDIWIMNANGAAKERLTGGPAFDSGPAFSPDGRKVAFARKADIYVKALDGTGLRVLTELGGRDTRPPAPSRVGPRPLGTQPPRR